MPKIFSKKNKEKISVKQNQTKFQKTKQITNQIKKGNNFYLKKAL